jgi:hypothetical protein
MKKGAVELKENWDWINFFKIVFVENCMVVDKRGEILCLLDLIIK